MFYSAADRHGVIVACPCHIRFLSPPLGPGEHVKV